MKRKTNGKLKQKKTGNVNTAKQDGLCFQHLSLLPFITVQISSRSVRL